MASSPPASGRKFGLDFARSVAILLVLLCHLLLTYRPGTRPLFTHPAGVLGVEIFFVLSGYLIGGIFLRDATSKGVTATMIGRFWVRRWMRTLPNYWLFLAVTMSFEGFVGYRQLAVYLTFTQNLAWRCPEFYRISWSLTIEEWFYLLMPVLVLLTYWIVKRLKIAFLIAVAVLFVGPLVLKFALAPGSLWDREVRGVVIFRLDALMFGVLLAAIERYRPSWFASLQRAFVCVLGLLLIAISSAYLGWRYEREGVAFTATSLDTLIFVGMDLGTALCLPLLANLRAERGPLTKFFYYTSLWSYSIYLCHIPILVAFVFVKRRYELNPDPLIEAPLALATVYMASAAIYYLFELPILNLRDRLTRHRSS